MATTENISKFLKEVLPDEEVRNYFLYLMARAYFHEKDAPEEMNKYIIWRGAGGNGKSVLADIIMLAFIKDSYVAQNVQKVQTKDTSIRVIYSTNTAQISPYRYEPVLQKVTLINIVNMYPKIKYFDHVFYRTINVIPFVSEFVEEGRVNPEKHQYLRKSFTMDEMKVFREEMKVLLQKVYEKTLGVEMPVPDAVKEENDGCKLYSVS